jgi:lipoprotein-anchoring transpeptidase ErfK/SrfK
MTKSASLSVNQLIAYGTRLAPDDPAAARKFFEKALSRDPDNITALLWLAGLAENGEDSLRYAVRVLEIDPKNERAKAAIRWARKRPRGAASPDRAAAAPIGATADQSPLETETPSRQSRAASIITGLIALMVLLCGAGLSVWLIAQPASAAASAVAQITPTLTALPTATNTPLPTATLPPTSTPLPAPTVTPQPPAATATAAPTSTPEPTATPVPTPEPLPTDAPYSPPATNPTGTTGEKWIDVDLTNQRLVAYEGDTAVYWVTVSTGLPDTPTVTGQYRIYVKYEAQTMFGPGYYLPDVPYVMYFYLGYGIHGTYWHNNFGHPMSHGCVNTPTPDAKWLYDWAPVGTLVNVHY